MKTIQLFLMGVGIALLVAGCATPQDYNHVSSQFPPIPAGEGRMIVYRGDEWSGGGQVETIKVDGSKVSNLQPNAFVYLDRPAGNYAVAGSAAGFLRFKLGGEPLNVSLSVGETKYIRLTVKNGLELTTYTTLEDADTAMQVLPKCIFNGAK